MSPRATSIATLYLDLVPLHVADADEMVDVLADPALYAITGGMPPSRLELVERFTRQVAGRSADGREEWHNWIVRGRVDGAAIGFVQATIVDLPNGNGRSADIAWVIGTRWQGRGDAARALVSWLTESGVDIVTAHIHPDHRASAAVAGRAGLEPTEVIDDGERVWRRIGAGEIGQGRDRAMRRTSSWSAADVRPRSTPPTG